MKAGELYRVINGMERQLNILKNEADKLLNEVYLCGKADQQRETADHFADIRKKVEEAYQKGYDEAKRIYQNPHAESDYQKGSNYMWDAARKISLMSPDEIEKVFPGAAKYNRYNLGYSGIEVIERLKAYEEKQKADAEIKVGDEVKSLDTGLAYIIHGIDGKYVEGYNFKSRLTCYRNKNNFKKTGRHFPQVAELLNAMKEGAE